MPASGCVVRLAVVDVQTADCLVHSGQEGGTVLGEQVAVDVLGGLDLAVSHLMRHLHIRSAGGDQQRGAYVPQLVRGVADYSVGIGGGVALRELEIPAPGGIAQVATPITVDQTAIESTLAALTPWCSMRY